MNPITDSNKIVRIGLTVLLLLLSVIAIIWILANPTGGIAGFSKVIIGLSVILSLTNPKMGLFFLVIQATYVDHMKRVGVYYGATSEQTVKEILIGPLITLAAINLGYLYRCIRGHYRLGKTGVILYILILIVTAGMFVGGFEGSSASLRLYNSTTIALYITLIPLCYGMFFHFDEWVKFVSLQALVAAPAAAWGIWQYYNGFSTMEWYYAETGLSSTHSAQMLMFADPRIFGWFGSASAYGCVGTLAIFSTWHAFSRKDHRFLYGLLAILYLACVIYSRQRSIALLFPISFIFAFLFRRKFTTLSAYASIAAIIIIATLNAQWLREEGLEKINSAIETDGRLGSTLNVDTFSDRLIGWERLSKADSWTIFGDVSYAAEVSNSEIIRDEERNHDIINKILIKYGAVGVLTTLMIAVTIFYFLHRAVLKAPSLQLRKDGAFILGIMIPSLILSFVGGSNYSTTPINMETWSIFAGVFIIAGSVLAAPQPPSLGNNENATQS